MRRIIMKRIPLCFARMSKVLIVDDSAVVRERLRQLLARVQGVDIAAEAAPAAGVLARRLKPDVIIIDVNMRNGGGIGHLRALKRVHPAPQLIVLTNEAYPEIRDRCLAAGADHFFDKSTEYQEIVAVLSAMPQRSPAH